MKTENPVDILSKYIRTLFCHRLNHTNTHNIVSHKYTQYFITDFITNINGVY